MVLFSTHRPHTLRLFRQTASLSKLFSIVPCAEEKMPTANRGKLAAGTLHWVNRKSLDASYKNLTSTTNEIPHLTHPQPLPNNGGRKEPLRASRGTGRVELQSYSISRAALAVQSDSSADAVPDP